LKETLLISEIFYSIQGEGPCIGIPAVFIRTAGCNLDCQWKVGNKIIACDTPYARKEGTKMSFTEIVHKTINKIGFNTIVVITGGEPTLQANQIKSLISKPYWLPSHVDLETNGTIPTDMDVPLKVWMNLFTHYIISPKSETIQNVHRLCCEGNNVYIKLVYDGSNIKFIEKARELASPLTDDRIFLMSAGTTPEELAKMDKKTIEICKRRGWRFSPRAHIYAYGKRRGV